MDRMPRPVDSDYQNMPMETVFRAGQRLPMSHKDQLLDLLPEPLDYSSVSQKIEELCATQEILGDIENNDGEEALVKMQDWLATDDQVWWGGERFAIGSV